MHNTAIVGLFCRNVGLFCRNVGLFCRNVGLFCLNVGTVPVMPCSTQHQVQSAGRRSTPRGPPDTPHWRLCLPPATEDACKGGPERMGMEAVGTWNVPTPLEEVHQDLETKERKKQLFYYHQANAAVNALGARVTEGAPEHPPPALLARAPLVLVPTEPRPPHSLHSLLSRSCGQQLRALLRAAPSAPAASPHHRRLPPPMPAAS